MAKKKVKKVKKVPRWKAAPLKGSFMVIGILGFLLSAYLIYPKNVSWGVTFMVVFGLMFIASLVSMTKAPIKEEWLLRKR